MGSKPNSWRQEAICKFCKNRIYRFTNRKPPGEWAHIEKNAYYCFLDERYSKDEYATPEKGG